jgi:hypothetical protein
MKKLIVLGLMTLSSAALAHPNGTYEIDNTADVTVTFAVVNRCPAVPGALSGSLRSLTFSEAATAEPYSFVTGNYVEKHVGAEEIYVQTDDQCVPVEDGEEIPASRSTFAGYPLRRVN